MPDRLKAEDIHNMPTPQDKENLHRFLGLMNLLAPYILNFFKKSKPLRALLKKDVPYRQMDEMKETLAA